MKKDTDWAALESTRSSLLERLKDLEDQEGWNDFFYTYWRLIYNVARKARMSDSEAMDVVQDTMISVAKDIGGFVYNREKGTFRGWLSTLTRRRVADFFRRQKRQLPRREAAATAGVDEEAIVLENLMDQNSPELERIWNEEWENSLIETALGRLRSQVSQRNLQIFHSHVIQGWSVVKTCRELGVNPGAVYLAKHRVGGLFKAELEVLQNQE
jgi:RNA polymerase sigma factor (sigma-70 family)